MVQPIRHHRIFIFLLLILLQTICFRLQSLNPSFSTKTQLLQFPETFITNPRLLSFDLAAHGILDKSMVATKPAFSPVINSGNLYDPQSFQTSNSPPFQIPSPQNTVSQEANLQNPRISSQHSVINSGSSNEILSNNNKKTKNTVYPQLPKNSALPPPDPLLHPLLEDAGQEIPMINGPFISTSITPFQKITALQWTSFVDQDLHTKTQKMQQQIRYYQSKYDTGSYRQLPFCIVVPTFNNRQNDRYLKNMRSILMQNYSNYHIIVIDDASMDSTGQLISTFLAEQTKISKDRYLVFRNQRETRAMPNLRKAAMEYCLPQDIFLVVDGDDQLLGRQVLKVFNANFQKNDAWFVYSNYVTVTTRQAGFSRPFPDQIKRQNNFRYYPFISSHLRAFYTQLFRNIREQDLKDQNGEYLKAANDVAICMPILEQSQAHVLYVPEITYYYNDNTGLNNHIVRAMEQRKNERRVRRKPRYRPLDRLF